MFLNKSIVAGNLTCDIELKTTATGKTFCDFSVAVNYIRKRMDGISEQIPEYIKCQAWGHCAEFLARNFKKGDGVGLVGRIHTKQWEDSKGNKKSTTGIQVDEVYFNGVREVPKPTATATLEECDDIPF